MSGAPQGGWALGENDRALLRQLITVLRRLLPLARSNVGLIALGEVLEAIEKVRSGAGVEEPVALSVGVEDGDEAFNEGRFVRLRIAPDGIVLDKLSTTFTAEIGLDEVTTGYAVLTRSGGFDSAGVAAWIAEVNDLRHWDTAELKSIDLSCRKGAS